MRGPAYAAARRTAGGPGALPCAARIVQVSRRATRAQPARRDRMFQQTARCECPPADSDCTAADIARLAAALGNLEYSVGWARGCARIASDLDEPGEATPIMTFKSPFIILNAAVLAAIALVAA